MWSVNDRAARDLPDTSWEPVTVIFRQKDQISGISIPKLSLQTCRAGNTAALVFSQLCKYPLCARRFFVLILTYIE